MCGNSCKKSCCKSSCYKPKCKSECYKPKCKTECYVTKCYTCYSPKPCGCRSLYDSNMGCKRNVNCILNSSKTYTSKEKYINHYHLKEVDYGCDC